jgi:hypothetical protein
MASKNAFVHMTNGIDRMPLQVGDRVVDGTGQDCKGRSNATDGKLL